MKKILYILPLLVSLVACKKDFLTRDNPTATTDEKWWKTESQLNSALASVYSALPQGGYAGNPNGRVFLSAITDDAYWNGNFYGSLNTVAVGDGSSNTGWPFDGIWNNDYGRIRQATRFMEHAGTAYMDASVKDRYIYEARALRAWYHLELFMYFGEIPIVKTVVSPTESAEMVKNSKEEVLQFIISELDICAAALPKSYTVDQSYRVTSGACIAMKAIAYLNAGQYAKAAEVAKQIIDSKTYELYKSGTRPYGALFSYEGKLNNERIFFKANALNDIWFRNAPSGVPPGPGQAVTNPTAALVNTYETKQGKTIQELGADSLRIYKLDPNYNNNRDPRFVYTILYPNEVYENRKLEPFSTDPNNTDRIGSPTGSATGFWVRKYLDPQDKGAVENSTLDLMLIRYADILLIYVEGLVENGDWQNPDVVKYLNEIRNRAGMPNVDVSVYNTQEKIRELYRRERRVELAFEGLRIFDIKRWKIGEQVMNGPVQGATNPATGTAVTVQTRKFNPLRDYWWPIPQKEINTSKITQNPNW